MYYSKYRVREKIEYRFRVPSAPIFTLYSYSKALEYPTAGSLMFSLVHIKRHHRSVTNTHKWLPGRWSRGCRLTIGARRRPLWSGSLVASTVFRPGVRARRGRCHRPHMGNTREEDARWVIATALKGSLSDALAWEGTRLRQRQAPEGRREAKGDKRRGTQYKLVVRADFF
jgi:hypothetical protein